MKKVARLLQAASNDVRDNNSTLDNRTLILKIKEDAQRNVFHSVWFNLKGKNDLITPKAYSAIHNWFRSERTIPKADVSKKKITFECIICCNTFIFDNFLIINLYELN